MAGLLPYSIASDLRNSIATKGAFFEIFRAGIPRNVTSQPFFETFPGIPGGIFPLFRPERRETKKQSRRRFPKMAATMIVVCEAHVIECIIEYTLLGQGETI